MPPTTFILDGHFTQVNTSVTIGEPFAKAPQYASAVLYIATTISVGPHELIITNLDGNDDTPLILDKFVYTPLDTEPQTASDASTSSGAFSQPGLRRRLLRSAGVALSRSNILLSNLFERRILISTIASDFARLRRVQLVLFTLQDTSNCRRGRRGRLPPPARRSRVHRMAKTLHPVLLP